MIQKIGLYPLLEFVLRHARQKSRAPMSQAESRTQREPCAGCDHQEQGQNAPCDERSNRDFRCHSQPFLTRSDADRMSVARLILARTRGPCGGFLSADT